jgi:hypothetical protein
MRLFRLGILALLLVACLSATAQAAVTDIRTVRTEVHKASNPTTCTAFPPLVGQLTCLRVVVQNLGPDPYTSTFSGVQKPLAGQLVITTDIDEPTKPGNDPDRIAASFTRSFAVNLAVLDSTSCDFGVVGWTPLGGGTHAARSTSYAGAPNIDPNPANDRMVSVFFVVASVPVTGRLGLMLLLAALGVAGVVWVRRTRSVRPAGA